MLPKILNINVVSHKSYHHGPWGDLFPKVCSPIDGVLINYCSTLTSRNTLLSWASAHKQQESFWSPNSHLMVHIKEHSQFSFISMQNSGKKNIFSSLLFMGKKYSFYVSNMSSRIRTKDEGFYIYQYFSFKNSCFICSFVYPFVCFLLLMLLQ